MTVSERGNPYNPDGQGTTTLEMLEGAVRYNRWLLSKMDPFLGTKNLELGAGHGTLTALVARDRDVVANEPSDAGRRVLAGRFSSNPRVRRIVADLNDLTEQDKFDSVYSANVLEHVADDVALMKQAARYLRPNGHIVAVVPAGAWLYSRFDATVGHCRRYSQGDRIRLSAALATGPDPMRLVAFRLFNPVGAIGWFIRMRLLRAAQIPAADALRFDRALPLLKPLDRIPFPFGQNLLMAFRK